MPDKKEETIRLLEKHYFDERSMDEKFIIKFFKYRIQDKDIFIDIGASLGQYTKVAAKFMKKGIIYAFEPDPWRYEELIKNSRKWSRGYGIPINVSNKAIGREPNTTKFYITYSGWSGGLKKNPNLETHMKYYAIDTEVDTLDNLFHDINNALIKIDTEGNELDIIRGATTIIENKASSFLIEIHWSILSPYNIDGNEIFKIFQKHGYNVEKLDHSHYYFYPENEV